MCKLIKLVLMVVFCGCLFADSEMTVVKNYFATKNLEDFKFLMTLQGQDSESFEKGLRVAISLNQLIYLNIGDKVYFMDTAGCGYVVIRRKGELGQYYTAGEVIQ